MIDATTSSILTFSYQRTLSFEVTQDITGTDEQEPAVESKRHARRHGHAYGHQARHFLQDRFGEGNDYPNRLQGKVASAFARGIDAEELLNSLVPAEGAAEGEGEDVAPAIESTSTFFFQQSLSIEISFTQTLEILRGA